MGRDRMAGFARGIRSSVTTARWRGVHSAGAQRGVRVGRGSGKFVSAGGLAAPRTAPQRSEERTAGAVRRRSRRLDLVEADSPVGLGQGHTGIGSSTPRLSQRPNVSPSAEIQESRPLQDRPRAIAPAVDGEEKTASRVRRPCPSATTMVPLATSFSCRAR